MSDEAEARRTRLLELQQLFLALDDSQQQTAVSVIRSLGKLGPNACEIVEIQAERQEFGAKQYERDYPEDLEYAVEAINEQLDQVAYSVMLMKQIKRLLQARKAAE